MFWEHFSPTCTTFSLAAGRYLQRRMDAPYGSRDQIKPEVARDSKIAVRTCALAAIKHAVGDLFTIEHPYPTIMLQFQCFEALLATPGVYVLTLDNCAYGESYRHRQCLVTNGAMFALLAVDCDKSHTHTLIGFDKPIKTHEVAAFSPGLCRAWASTFVSFLRLCTNAFGGTSAKTDVCVHCAAQAGADRPPGALPRVTDKARQRVMETVRRAGFEEKTNWIISSSMW